MVMRAEHHQRARGHFVVAEVAARLLGQHPRRRDRQVRIDRADVLLQPVEDFGARRAGPRVDDHDRAVALRGCEVDVGPRRFRQTRVLDVADDAHDRAPVAIGQREARPMAPCGLSQNRRASVSLTIATFGAAASSPSSNSRPASSVMRSVCEVVGPTLLKRNWRSSSARG